MNESKLINNIADTILYINRTDVSIKDKCFCITYAMDSGEITREQAIALAIRFCK